MTTKRKTTQTRHRNALISRTFLITLDQLERISAIALRNNLSLNSAVRLLIDIGLQHLANASKQHVDIQ